MMDLENVRDILRHACDVWGSQVKFAKRWGISPAYVNDCLLGRREPGAKILKALRLKKVVSYINVCIFSLLLSCGVAEAGPGAAIISMSAANQLNKKETGPEITGTVTSNILHDGDQTHRFIPLKKKQICGPNMACVDAQKGKHVVIEYNDFLKMIAMKEHSDKTANRYAAENAVLVKLKDEQSTVIQLQKEDIQACREIVKSHEQLGETESQISKAVEAELRKALEEANKKNWVYFGAGAASGATAVGIIAAAVWGMRR